MFTSREDNLSFTTTNFVPRSIWFVVSVDIGILIMQGVARLETPAATTAKTSKENSLATLSVIPQTNPRHIYR